MKSTLAFTARKVFNQQKIPTLHLLNFQQSSFQKNVITVRAYDDALCTIVGEEDVTWESLLCLLAFDVTFNKIIYVVTKVSRQ